MISEIPSNVLIDIENLEQELWWEKWWTIGTKRFTSNTQNDLTAILWSKSDIKSNEGSLSISGERSLLTKLGADQWEKKVRSTYENNLREVKNAGKWIDKDVKLKLLHNMLNNPENYFDDVQHYLTQKSLHTHPTWDLRASGTDKSTYKQAFDDTNWKTTHHYIWRFDSAWALYLVQYDHNWNLVHHRTWWRKLMISKTRWWKLLDWVEKCTIDHLANVEETCKVIWFWARKLQAA